MSFHIIDAVWAPSSWVSLLASLLTYSVGSIDDINSIFQPAGVSFLTSFMNWLDLVLF